MGIQKTWLGWQVTIPALDILPIKMTDDENQKQIESKVKMIQDLYKQLTTEADNDHETIKAITEEIENIDKDIDKTVLEIYGITPEQQKIMELE